MSTDGEHNRSVQHNITISENEKPSKSSTNLLGRVNTSNSAATSNTDTMSVRSRVMKSMNFKKIKNRDNANVSYGPDYHAMDGNAVAEILKTDTEQGLTNAEAADRIARHGHNELAGEGGVSAWKVLFRQLVNIMILILVIAMVSTQTF
jgi:Na+-exporting ATPase